MTRAAPFTLRLRALEIGYGRRRLAGPLGAEWSSGRVHAVVGPNGCGKSTLLRTLLGHVPPIAGAVEGLADRRVGAVPQISALDDGFPVTVQEVVETGLPRLPRRDRRARIANALAAVGMADRPSQRYFRLSGGQRQRVLIARALATDADVLALDEPTAGVDADAAQSVWELLRDLAQNDGKLVVVVTHDLFHAADFAHSTHTLRDGQLAEQTA